jgi:hypothetical protein
MAVTASSPAWTFYQNRLQGKGFLCSKILV